MPRKRLLRIPSMPSTSDALRRTKAETPHNNEMFHYCRALGRLLTVHCRYYSSNNPRRHFATASRDGCILWEYRHCHKTFIEAACPFTGYCHVWLVAIVVAYTCSAAHRITCRYNRPFQQVAAERATGMVLDTITDIRGTM
jgi:hypothetical protein